jgi:hypothetical protein
MRRWSRAEKVYKSVWKRSERCRAPSGLFFFFAAALG